MANATTFLTSPSSSSSSPWILKHKSPNSSTFKQPHSFPSSIHFDYSNLSRFVFIAPPLPSVSSSSSSSSSHSLSHRFPVIFTVLDQEAAVTEEVIEEDDVNKIEGSISNQELRKQPRPCELYVCNLPRTCDIAQLVELFKPFWHSLGC